MQNSQNSFDMLRSAAARGVRSSASMPQLNMQSAEDLPAVPLVARIQSKLVSDFDFTVIDGLTKITLKLNTHFAFHGRCQIRVSSGRLSVYGKGLTPDGIWYSCYSPTNEAALCIYAVGDTKSVFDVKPLIGDGLDDLGKMLPALKNVFDANRQQYEYNDALTVDGFHPLRNVWGQAIMSIHEAWFRVPVAASGSWLVCGERNRGKSTFTRFMCCRLLDVVPQVAYLDMDAGQSEFTPCGCISVTVVDKPLLGPSFTHGNRNQVHQCFYGHTSMDQDPARYFDCVAQCWLALMCSEYADLPLVINTAGWMTGVGGDLLQQILHLIRPKHVVELVDDAPRLQIDTKARDYRWVSQHCQQLREYKQTQTKLSQWSCQVYNLPGAHQQQANADRPAKDQSLSRLLQFMAYFYSEDVAGSHARKWTLDMSLKAMVPYNVKYADVGLEVLDGQHLSDAHTLAALNVSIVALERSSSRHHGLIIREHCQPRECLGFGLVRACDLNANGRDSGMFIITPLTLSQLEPVDVVCRGSVTLDLRVWQSQVKTGDLYTAPDAMFDGLISSGPRKTRRKILR